MSAAFWALASSSDGSAATLGTLDVLRLDRPGFRAAARADTGVEPRRDGVRDNPFGVVVGDRVWPREGVPFVDWSVAEVLFALAGDPGLRGVADILTENGEQKRLNAGN